MYTETGELKFSPKMTQAKIGKNIQALLRFMDEREADRDKQYWKKSGEVTIRLCGAIQTLLLNYYFLVNGRDDGTVLLCKCNILDPGVLPALTTLVEDFNLQVTILAYLDYDDYPEQVEKLKEYGMI